MSTTIDERVVEMRFDNSNFEKNVSQSMSTLEKLKNALNFSSLGKTADAIEETSWSLGTNGLAGAVDSVSMKFDALQVMAVTALANITNSAVNAGLELAKSFTIDPITSGWSKFSELTMSKATLEAQGYSAEEIESVMASIATYTDETSYHISEMTGAIGKMTATGMDLEEAAQVAMGVSNMVALGGQNAAVADRIYTQLAQAMGAGAMKRQDWMSFQTAQLDTAEFRKQALEAAVASDVMTKVGDDLYKVGGKVANAGYWFGEGLTKFGWFNNEVIQKVFSGYNAAFDEIYAYMDENGGTFSEAIDAVSASYERLVASEDKAQQELGNAGLFAIKALLAAQQARTFEDFTGSIAEAVSTQWASIFQSIFGDTQQAIKLWTGLSNTLWTVFAGPIERIANVFSIFSDMGGTGHFIGAILSLAEAMEAVTDAALEGFWGLIDDEDSAAHILDLAKAFENFAKSLIPTEKRSEQISRTFAGFRAVFDLIGTVVRNIAYAFSRELNPELGTFGDIIWEATGSLGDFLVNLTESIKESPAFWRALQNIGKNAAIIVETFGKLFYGFDFSEIVSNFKKYGGGLAGVFGIATDQIDILLDAIQHLVQSITGKEFPKFWEKVHQAVDWVRTTVVPTIERWSKAFDEHVVQPIKQWVSEGGLTNFLQKVKEYGKAVFDYLKNKAPGIITTIVEKLQGVTDWINKKIPQDKLKWLHDILTKFSDTLQNVKDRFKPVETGVENLANTVDEAANKSGWQKFKDWLTDTWDALKEIGGKIKEKAQPIIDWFKEFSEKIDWERFVTIAAVVGSLIGIMKYYFEHSAKQNPINDLQTLKDIGDSLSGLMDAWAEKAMAEAIRDIAISIGILALAIGKIAEIPADKLERSTKAIAGLMALMGFMTGAFDDFLNGSVFQGGLWSDLFSGGTKKMEESISSTITGVSESADNMKNAKAVREKMFAMIEIAAAIYILAESVMKLKDFTPEQIVNTMSMVSTLMVELGGVVIAIDKWGSENDVTKAGTMMIAMSIAIGILALVMGYVADIYDAHKNSGEKAVATVAILVGELGLVAIAMERLGKEASPGGILASGAMFIALAVAVQLIAPIVSALAAMFENVEDPGSVWQAAGIVAGLISVLCLLAIGLEKASKEASPGGVLAAVPLILAIGVAFDAVAIAMGVLITIFANNSEADITTALISGTAIVVLIGAIGILLVALSNDSNPVSILSAAAALLAMGVAFDAMAVAVGALAVATKIAGRGNMVTAAAVLFGLMMGAAVALYVLAQAGPVAVIAAAAILVVAVSLGVIAASLVIFIAAFAMLPGVIERFSSIPWETLLDGLAKLAVAIVALTVTTAILTAGAAAMALFAASILVMVAAVAVLGGAIAVIGAGLAALGTAIMTFAAMDAVVIAKFGETLARIIAQLQAVIPMVLTLIGSFISGILTIINDRIPEVFTIMGTFVDELGKFVEEKMPTIVETIKTLIEGVLEILREEIPNWAETLISILLDLLTTIDENIDRIITKVVSIGFNIVYGLIAGVLEGTASFVDKIMTGLVGFFNALTLSIRSNTANLKASYERCVNAIIDLIIAFFESNKDIFKETAKKLFGEDFVSGVEEISETLRDIPRKIVEWITEAFNKLEIVQKIKQAGKNFFQQFNSGLTGSDGFDSHSPSKAMENVADDAADGFTGGIEDKFEEITTSGSTFAEKFLFNFKGFGDLMSEKAGSGIRSFIDSFKGKKVTEDLTAAGSGLASTAAGGANDTATDTKSSTSFYNAGANGSLGFISGLNSKLANIRYAAKTAAEAAIKSFNSGLQEQSPSKLTYQSGEYFDLGFINALADNEKKVGTAAFDTADGAVDSFNKAINQELGIDLDTNPVIRPILDLTEIQNGASRLQELLYGASGISAGSRLAVATGVGLDRSGFGEDLYDAVSELRRTVDTLMNNPKTEINNQFDIYSETDPELIADTVAARIQQQVDMKESRWA